MASANVELVRGIFAPWERGDFTNIDWADPGIEFVGRDGPTAGTSEGIAAMGDAWRETISVWEKFRVAAEDYRELDDGRVLVLTTNTGRGKTSGLELGEMRTQGANLFEVHGGKVTRLTLYWDRDRALADLGLTA